MAGEIGRAIAKLEASSIGPCVLVLVASAIGYKVGFFSPAITVAFVAAVASYVVIIAAMYAFEYDIFAPRSGRWELATHYRSLPPRVRGDTLRDRL